LEKKYIETKKNSKSAVKLLEKRKPLPPVASDTTLLRNKEYEQALQRGKVENYKVSFSL
jgi:hypothetical protein